MLRAAADVPPIMSLFESSTEMPASMLGNAFVPVGSVPTKSPVIDVAAAAIEADSVLIELLIASPCNVLLPAMICSPSEKPALAPLNWIKMTALSLSVAVLGLEPGWL